MAVTAKNKVHANFKRLAGEARLGKPSDLAAQIKAVEMKLAGKGWAEIKKITGLNHSKLDRAWYFQDLLENHPDEYVAGEFSGWSEERQNAHVATLRASGMSWGKISLRIGVTEGGTQTRFERVTGLSAQGTRTGHGGRFFQGEKRFYDKNRKGIGVEFEKAKGVPDPASLKDGDKVTSVIPSRLANAKVKVKATPTKRKARTAKPKPQPKDA